MSAAGLLMRRTAAAALRHLCVVPEALSVTDWADRYRMLPETSTAPGPYDSAVTPYARRWMDLGADPSVSMLALCWAVQTTKSTVIENILAYRIARAPSPMVVVQPKIDAAESWAKERFVPMVRTTPVLTERVRLGRSTDSTLRYKRFPGGFLFVASAQSATELASRSAPFVALDEVDRYEVIPGEGNPVEIALRRQGAADVGLAILTSTPRDSETTIIWPYLEGGTHEFYHVPCPHCAFPQRLIWANLRWEKGDPRTAHYVCVDCGAVIEESAKRAMLDAGEWVPTNPGAPYPSSHLHGLYSPFAKSSWAVLAGEFERAQGKPADLQVVVNTRFAELWSETVDRVDPEGLAQRAEPMAEGVVPVGVGLLTAGVDVQVNRLEVYVWGWGAGMESWPIASFVLDGDPQQEPDAPGSVWRALDAVRAKRFPRVAGDDSPVVPITACAIDTGFATGQVYRYVHRRRGQALYAVKGVGGQGVALLGKPTLQGRERVPLYAVGTDTAKNEFLRSQIMERAIGPGYVHIADWLTTDQLEQLVAEKRTRRVHRGKVLYEWVRKRQDAPNEALDCRLYARIALERQGSLTIAKLGQLAATLTAAGEVAPPDGDATPSGQPAPRPPRRPGFVRRW